MEHTLTDVMIRRDGVTISSGSEAIVKCETLIVTTTTAPEFVDITDDVERIVAEAAVKFGQVTIFSKHTTAAIKINENEPLLMGDMCRVLEQAAPKLAEYDHNDFSRRTGPMEEDECANGHAHCQHLFLGASENVPIIDGHMALGRWQRIFLVELDMPRERSVLVNIVGTTA